MSEVSRRPYRIGGLFKYSAITNKQLSDMTGYSEVHISNVFRGVHPFSKNLVVTLDAVAKVHMTKEDYATFKELINQELGCV